MFFAEPHEESPERDGSPERDRERTVEERVAAEVAQTGSVTAQTPRGGIHCLTVVGQIEGHSVLPSSTKSTKYEHVIPQLAAIEESPEIQGLLVILNTVGGDVEAGLAIAEMLASMEKPTVSLVLGGGHSIGVPLAVAARRSFIVPSATMTIHPVRFTGMVIGAPQTFAYFQKMQERIVRFVTANSHMEESRFRKLMLETDELASDMGTVVDGAEAVRMGLIDELGGLSQALRALHEQIDG
ncbi:MAG: ATP-dependent Clp protease proteolytic subunit [Eubacteriales bacterium]|nr:ATP-dependent Clp protease proteolytic subunit [Eubacteriales bacterium]